MLEKLFQAMFLTSCIGTALSLILLMLKPVTKKYFSSNWHYYIWLVVLFVMMLPVRFPLPTDTPPMTTTPIQTAMLPAPQTNVPAHLEPQETAQPIQTAPTPATLILLKTLWENQSMIFPLLWLAVAAGLLLLKLLNYAAFLHSVRKHSSIIPCPALAAFTDRKILVRISDRVHSPLIVGVLKPTLLLPETEMTPQQLEHVLAHETTHLKRKDICYKWFVSFVKCIHWFNPMIYIVQHQINLECEISCDLAVTKYMNETETRGYADTILMLLTAGRSKPIPLTTGMTGSKKNLKRRFIMMKNKKNVSKLTSALSVILAAALLSTTIFASGALSYFIADDYTIEITNNGEKIMLSGKPFIENGCVYVPLRETLEKAGFHDGNSDIRWDDGKIEVAIMQSTGEAGLFHMEIGKQNVALRHIDAAALHTAAIDDPAMIRTGIIMENPPVLKGWTTYVPTENLNYMLYNFFNIRTADGSLYNLTYSIYDKNNNDITTQFDAAKQTQQEAELMKNPEYTAANFFAAFENSNFEAMKKYCTDNCIAAYFKENAVFGMKKATLELMDIDPLEYAKSSNDFNVFVTVSMTPHEQSVFDQNQTSTSFYVCLVRQPDGRYFIDSFATGL